MGWTAVESQANWIEKVAVRDYKLLAAVSKVIGGKFTTGRICDSYLSFESN